MARTWMKEAGVSVFPMRAHDGLDSVAEALVKAEPWRKEIPWPEGYDAGIAHRLDVYTSGALWIADTLEELVEMRERFRGRKLVKHYRLLASKDVSWSHNQCDREIAHDRRKKGKMVVRRGQNTPHRGRWYSAQTAVSRLEGNLWEVRMETGVMHQIRVHCAFLGIPLLGDKKYGGGVPPDFAHWGGFCLHHLGLSDSSGWGTEPVALPQWARTSRDRVSTEHDPKP